tara:strand:- start:48 stop:458 length:411 start_codon:yes stop_codon:yes gene_type:complete
MNKIQEIFLSFISAFYTFLWVGTLLIAPIVAGLEGTNSSIFLWTAAIFFGFVTSIFLSYKLYKKFFDKTLKMIFVKHVFLCFFVFIISYLAIKIILASGLGFLLIPMQSGIGLMIIYLFYTLIKDVIIYAKTDTNS